MSARRAVRGASLLAVAALTSFTVLAQDLWYRSYADGVAAFKKGDYATAEAKITAALRGKDTPTARGRRVLYYSQIRDEFLPEYYLAIINQKNGNYREALRFAEAAEKYLTSSDREYASLQNARTASQTALNTTTPSPPLETPRGGTPQNAGGDTTTTRPNPVVTPSPSPSPRAAFDALVRQSRTALGERRWDDARTAAGNAKALGVDNRQADDLLKAIDVADLTAQVNTQVGAKAWPAATTAVDRLARADPSNSLVTSARTAIAAGLASDDAVRLERTGMRAFYRGNYQEALTTLSQARLDAAPAADRDRIQFYIACSNAALALLEGAGGKARLTRAQEQYRQLRTKDALFAVDRRYISPQILNSLQGRS